jgi:pyruvate ferredoxin oxidoreductase gamma subunit
VVAAEILANAFVLGGQYASVFPSFGTERRGSAVVAFARFGDKPVREHTRVYRPDIVLILDQSLGQSVASYNGFQSGGMVIANTTQAQQILDLNLKQRLLATVDATTIALREIGSPIPNTCMLGAFAKATGLVELENLKEALKLFFKGEMLAANLRSMEKGFEQAVAAHFAPDLTAAKTAPAWSEASPEIKAPVFISSFQSPWVDVEKKLLTVQTGEWRYQRPELNPSVCRICGWCSIYCPVGCLSAGRDHYYHPDFDYCKGCGVCAAECPAGAIRMRLEEAVQ